MIIRGCQTRLADYFLAGAFFAAARFAGAFLATAFFAGAFLTAAFFAGAFFATAFFAGAFLATAFFAAGATFPPWVSTLHQIGTSRSPP